MDTCLLSRGKKVSRKPTCCYIAFTAHFPLHDYYLRHTAQSVGLVTFDLCLTIGRFLCLKIVRLLRQSGKSFHVAAYPFRVRRIFLDTSHNSSHNQNLKTSYD